MSDSSSKAQVMTIAKTKCGDGSCPTVHVLLQEGKRPQLILQGYVDSSIKVNAGEGTRTVRINRELAEECAKVLTASRWKPDPSVSRTNAVVGINGELLMMGRAITDPETLAMFNLPLGETVIGIELDSLDAGVRLLQFAGHTGADLTLTKDVASIATTQTAAPVGVQL